MVAQFASYDHSERDPPSDTIEVTAWDDTITYESRPKKPTIGGPVVKQESHNPSTERSPLLSKTSVARISEAYEGSDDGYGHDVGYRRILFDEVKTLARYTLPVFG